MKNHLINPNLVTTHKFGECGGVELSEVKERR